MTLKDYISTLPNDTGILFDLDGVLVDSEGEYTHIWDTIDAEFPTGVENFSTVIKGGNLTHILDKYFPDADTQRKVVERLYALEEKMTYQYTEGARALLEFLHANGYRTALYTSSNADKMRHLYRDIPEMESWFDTIVLGNMVSKSKPHPEGYILAAERLGIPAERCVVVEDSRQGMQAGRSAGAFVVGVPGTLSPETVQEMADLTVSALS